MPLEICWGGGTVMEGFGENKYLPAYLIHVGILFTTNIKLKKNYQTLSGFLHYILFLMYKKKLLPCQ